MKIIIRQQITRLTIATDGNVQAVIQETTDKGYQFIGEVLDNDDGNTVLMFEKILSTHTDSEGTIPKIKDAFKCTVCNKLTELVDSCQLMVDGVLYSQLCPECYGNAHLPTALPLMAKRNNVIQANSPIKP